MEKLVLKPMKMKQYQLTLKIMDGDGFFTDTQEAEIYLIHRSGFHIFVTHGRIVRSIAGWRVVEIEEGV